MPELIPGPILLIDEGTRSLADGELVKLIDVKLTLQGLRNVVEYEEALKSALASSASGTYGGMLVDVYVGVVSGSSPEAVKLGAQECLRIEVDATGLEHTAELDCHAKENALRQNLTTLRKRINDEMMQLLVDFLKPTNHLVVRSFSVLRQRQENLDGGLRLHRDAHG